MLPFRSFDDQPKKKVCTEVVVAAHDSSQTLPSRITLSKPLSQDNKDMLDGTYDEIPYKLQRLSTKEPRVNDIIDFQRRFQHDNVLKLLTVESTESYHFLVFEKYNCTLEQYLQKKHNMSTPRSTDIDILKYVFLYKCFFFFFFFF